MISKFVEKTRLVVGGILFRAVLIVHPAHYTQWLVEAIQEKYAREEADYVRKLTKEFME